MRQKREKVRKKTYLGVSLCAIDCAGPFTSVTSFKEMKKGPNVNCGLHDHSRTWIRGKKTNP